jgi:hypothetical protein
VPLRAYAATGVLVTRLGQRLVHPAAVVQYVAAVVAGLSEHSRAAVAVPPAAVVSALRHWRPAWAAGVQASPASSPVAAAAAAAAVAASPVLRGYGGGGGGLQALQARLPEADAVKVGEPDGLA